MVRRATALCGLAALGLVGSAPPVQAQQTERFTLSGDEVSVFNLAGGVQIERGSGSEVVVEVRRGGRDAARLDIARISVDGRRALVVRYPDGDVVYSGSGRGDSQTSLRVRDDGTFYGDTRGGDRVDIRSSGRGTEAHADLRILVPAGRALDVRLGVGEVMATGVDGDLSIDVGAAPVTTRSTRGRLLVDTGSGRVTVADAEGDVLVDTGSGRVDVSNVRGNRMLIDTGSGSVEGSGVRAEQVHIDTGSGRVSLTGVASSDVEIDTGSGAVDLQLLTDVDRLFIDTGSGSVRVIVPEALGAEFEIDGSRVSVEAPAQIRESDRDHARGMIGDGRGTIEIDTGSGRVTLVRG